MGEEVGKEQGNRLADSPNALSPAARRALNEAQERREVRTKQAANASQEKEYRGRAGLDPARYGDWEIKGLACDF